MVSSILSRKTAQPSLNKDSLKFYIRYSNYEERDFWFFNKSEAMVAILDEEIDHQPQFWETIIHWDLVQFCPVALEKMKM
jgi:hypothetical protein